MDRTNQMYQSSGSFEATNIKRKLIELEKNISQVTSEIMYRKNEVQIMRSETDTLENVLTNKSNEVRMLMIKDIQKVEENIDRSLKQQQTENVKMQNLIFHVNAEKTQLQQNLLHLERRLVDVEEQVGEELR